MGTVKLPQALDEITAAYREGRLVMGPMERRLMWKRLDKTCPILSGYKIAPFDRRELSALIDGQIEECKSKHAEHMENYKKKKAFYDTIPKAKDPEKMERINKLKTQVKAAMGNSLTEAEEMWMLKFQYDRFKERLSEKQDSLERRVQNLKDGLDERVQFLEGCARKREAKDDKELTSRFTKSMGKSPIQATQKEINECGARYMTKQEIDEFERFDYPENPRGQ